MADGLHISCGWITQDIKRSQGKENTQCTEQPISKVVNQECGSAQSSLFQNILLFLPINHGAVYPIDWLSIKQTALSFGKFANKQFLPQFCHVWVVSVATQLYTPGYLGTHNLSWEKLYNFQYIEIFPYFRGFCCI